MFIKTYTYNKILLTLYYQNPPGGEGEAKEIVFYLLKETHLLPVSWLQKQIPRRMTDSQEMGCSLGGRGREPGLATFLVHSRGLGDSAGSRAEGQATCAVVCVVLCRCSVTIL